MKPTIFSILILLTSNCAQKKYLDRDINNPDYHEGTGIAVTDNVGVGGVSKSSNVTPLSYSTKDAMMGLIESGISLAAYPNYYKASTIRGSCVLGDSLLTQTPCRNLKIELIDESGKSVSAANCNEFGQFAFYVKKNKSYKLRLAESKYTLDSKDGGLDHRMGANIIVHAVPNQN